MLYIRFFERDSWEYLAFKRQRTLYARDGDDFSLESDVQGRKLGYRQRLDTLLVQAVNFVC